MLLAEEANALEHRPRPVGGGVEARPEPGVFLLELTHALLGARVAATALGGDRLQPRFGLVRALAKRGQFLAEVPDEGFEFSERLRIRTHGG